MLHKRVSEYQIVDADVTELGQLVILDESEFLIVLDCSGLINERFQKFFVYHESKQRVIKAAE